jgi:uncharacterized phage protein (TIGR02216 family)
VNAARESFGDIALRLAGQAGWHLGWSAEQFWNATPAEMEAVVRAMLGADGAAGGGDAPPDRTDIARLMEIYPDG